MAGGEDCHIAILHRPDDEKTRLPVERPGGLAEDRYRRDKMPVALRFVDVGLAQRAYPILHHVARGRVNKPERQPAS
jgi:hypothetical protein